MKLDKIVLTGGPCAGKSTALARIVDHFQNFGIKVYTVPEVATLLITGGIKPWELPEAELMTFQQNILNTQLALENAFEAQAQVAKKPAILLCDRGTCDNKAYLSTEAWTKLLQSTGKSEGELKNRYNAVLHLVTAAIGAENFYTLANNSARSETPEQAKALDLRTRQAWVGHPHLRVINNAGDFEHKLRRIVAEVANVVGIPEPLEIERKFTVDAVDLTALEKTQPHTSRITQDYLAGGTLGTERVRSRTADGYTVYTHTIKVPAAVGVEERERLISKREYEYLLQRRDPSKQTIVKDRTCFLYKDQYFELDTFLSNPGLKLLEIEVSGKDQPIELPPFMGGMSEVTGDPAYSNSHLARAAKTPKKETHYEMD